MKGKKKSWTLGGGDLAQVLLGVRRGARENQNAKKGSQADLIGIHEVFGGS